MNEQNAFASEEYTRTADLPQKEPLTEEQKKQILDFFKNRVQKNRNDKKRPVRT